jgi:HSP20 family protein
MKAMAELKQGLSEGWKSIAEGWEHVRQRAGAAMTRYRRDRIPRNFPTASDDEFPLSSPHWGLLAGEVFEDRGRIVVRLEAPGMDVKDFDVQVYGNIVALRGEKRSAREAGPGTWRMRECAYGTFERAFRLPAEVSAEKATASYRRGVLRIELPKAKPDVPRHVKVTVQ